MNISRKKFSYGSENPVKELGIFFVNSAQVSLICLPKLTFILPNFIHLVEWDEVVLGGLAGPGRESWSLVTDHHTDQGTATIHQDTTNRIY